MSLLTKEQYTRSLIVPDENCPICTEPYNDTDHVAVRLNCGHWFGTSCAINTVETAQAPTCEKCPMCRAQLYTASSNTGQPSAARIMREIMASWEEFLLVDESVGIAFMQLLKQTLRPHAPFLIERLRISQRTADHDVLNINHFSFAFSSTYSQVIYTLEGHIRRRHPEWTNIARHLQALLDAPPRSDQTPSDTVEIHVGYIYFMSFLKAMGTHGSACSAGSLSPHTAKLWWKLLKTMSNSDTNAERITLNDCRQLVHLLIVMMNLGLVNNPETFTVLHPTNMPLFKCVRDIFFELDPEYIKFYSNDLDHALPHVYPVLQRMQAETGDSSQPRFVGRPEERADYERLWREARYACLKPMRDFELAQAQQKQPEGNPNH